MGALYVKDDEALRLAETLAKRRGLTKVAAVKLALANELASDAPERRLADVARELRRTSSLPSTNPGVADKAFFDSLYDG